MVCDDRQKTQDAQEVEAGSLHAYSRSADEPGLKDYPYIRRCQRGSSVGWEVQLGTVYRQYFPDADYASAQGSLQAAFADRDRYLPAFLEGTLSSNRESALPRRSDALRKRTVTTSNQLRVRMTPQEREMILKQCDAEIEAGKVIVTDISGWVRYHLQPLLDPSLGGPCYVEKKLYDRLQSIADMLEKNRAEIVEEGVKAILEMIEDPSFGRGYFHLRRSCSSLTDR